MVGCLNGDPVRGRARRVECRKASSEYGWAQPANDPNARAIFTIKDTCAKLQIWGNASGLGPVRNLHILIYDNLSNRTDPLTWREPDIFDPGDTDYILDTMFTCAWTVNENGFGVLRATNIVDDLTGDGCTCRLTSSTRSRSVTRTSRVRSAPVPDRMLWWPVG